jgi:hypothetical protein
MSVGLTKYHVRFEVRTHYPAVCRFVSFLAESGRHIAPFRS